MVDAEKLVKAGYRPFRDKASLLKGEGCEALWQKRIEDERGTCYFINVYEWNLGRVVPGYPGKSPSFSSEVQFTRGEGNMTVDVNCHGHESQTIEEIESFFAEVWSEMGFNHYEIFGWVSTVEGLSNG